MRILITGFEPFADDACNPSMQVLSLLPEEISGIKIVTCVLPVVRFEAAEKVIAAIEKENPDAVISLGLAAGRRGITLERTAVNIDSYRIADNKGNRPADEPVDRDGPCAYFSSLPIRKMEAAILSAGYPASVSESAGTFVCNHVFYSVRRWCELNRPRVISGFIHLPCSDEMAAEGQFSMSLNDMEKAIEAAVSVFSQRDA